jgi:hypothetical protein
MSKHVLNTRLTARNLSGELADEQAGIDAPGVR